MATLHFCVVTQLEIRPGKHVEKPPVLQPVLLVLVSDDLMEVVRCGMGDSFVS
jgi:hypothetical protein